MGPFEVYVDFRVATLILFRIPKYLISLKKGPGAQRKIILFLRTYLNYIMHINILFNPGKHKSVLIVFFFLDNFITR